MVPSESSALKSSLSDSMNGANWKVPSSLLAEKPIG